MSSLHHRRKLNLVGKGKHYLLNWWRTRELARHFLGILALSENFEASTRSIIRSPNWKDVSCLRSSARNFRLGQAGAQFSFTLFDDMNFCDLYHLLFVGIERCNWKEFRIKCVKGILPMSISNGECWMTSNRHRASHDSQWILSYVSTFTLPQIWTWSIKAKQGHFPISKYL